MRESSKISSDENEHINQIFITPPYSLNFLLKFSIDNLFIIEIISTKFHEKIHPLNPPNEWH